MNNTMVLLLALIVGCNLFSIFPGVTGQATTCWQFTWPGKFNVDALNTSRFECEVKDFPDDEGGGGEEASRMILYSGQDASTVQESPVLLRHLMQATGEDGETILPLEVPCAKRLVFTNNSKEPDMENMRKLLENGIIEDVTCNRLSRMCVKWTEYDHDEIVGISRFCARGRQEKPTVMDLEPGCEVHTDGSRKSVICFCNNRDLCNQATSLRSLSVPLGIFIWLILSLFGGTRID